MRATQHSPRPVAYRSERQVALEVIEALVYGKPVSKDGATKARRDANDIARPTTDARLVGERRMLNKQGSHEDGERVVGEIANEKLGSGNEVAEIGHRFLVEAGLALGRL